MTAVDVASEISGKMSRSGWKRGATVSQMRSHAVQHALFIFVFAGQAKRRRSSWN